MKKKLRLLLSLVATLLTLYVAYRYLSNHRNLITQLGHTPLTTIGIVLGLYVIMFGVLLLILSATIRICNIKVGKQENILLNAYSIFINFLIPGQGGPAFRGIYLKKKYGLKFKSFIIVSLIYYAIYGAIGIFLILLGSRVWWQTALYVLLVGSFGLLAMRITNSKPKFTKLKLSISAANLSLLLLVTILQSLVQIVIFYIELHSAQGHIGLHQVVIYTGVANLALFVSLTPGSIGIRESFLVFSEKLHHISSSSIVIANVIDRSVYLIFLLLLLVLMLSLHAKDKLLLKSEPQTIEKSS